MSEPDCEIAVAARFAALPELLAHLCRRASAAGIGEACRQRMQLVVEELFANTIHHGHGGECDATVRLAVSCDKGCCRLQYRDSAPAFDPLQAPALPPMPDRFGGAGLHLVRRLIHSGCYTRSDAGNQLDLLFKEQA